MNKQKLGFVIFLIGAVYMFVMGWLVMWWVLPMWRSAPPEEFNRTILEVGGPMFMAMAFSVPVGILFGVLGMLLYAEAKKSRIFHFAIVAVFIIVTMMFPSTLGYYPIMFGILGGLIVVLFFGILWIWAKRRPKLEGSARTAADLQTISYMFFFAAASLICTLLGNPFTGLYFPEMVLEYSSLPYSYSFGTKIIVYLALGWLFALLGHYKAVQGKSKDERL
ncbi:MAG: hypothetical protein C5S45_06955 [Candidatus Methanocomedens sp.]|jgi:MFS family permease|nr:MAG: hypothetical protein C5S45_06955 [ANME-2 cluster archaeon]